MRRSILLLIWAWLAVLGASCGGDSFKTIDCRGEEGCACNEDGSCGGRLACRSDRCVDLGMSTSSCAVGQTNCSGRCVQLERDSLNCGRCDRACEAGSQCRNSACVCPTGSERCASGCVETGSDPDHCGACDSACGEDEVCSEGACSGECAEGLTSCGRQCVDIETSFGHCGECDSRCATGQACEDGACACPDAQGLCAGSCVNTNDDVQHCGECGNACVTGELCDDGECRCPDGEVPCGAGCTPEGSCGAAGSGGAAGGGRSGAGGMPSAGSAGMNVGGGTVGGSAGNTDGGTAGSAGNDGDPDAMPTVLLLLNRSSGMFEPSTASRWDMFHSALTRPEDGVLQAYADRIRLGLASYRGISANRVPEEDERCAEVTNVAIAERNHDAVVKHYAELTDAGITGATKWDTPTGHAIQGALPKLLADPAPGRKYILLLTGGDPDTCQVKDPQCGQDLAIHAIQQARAQGIRVLAVGVGSLSPNTPDNVNCLLSTAPCGSRHLQDMSNAGLGLNVEPPPASYPFQTCVSTLGGLRASYAEPPGTATMFYGEDQDSVRKALEKVFSAIVMGSIP